MRGYKALNKDMINRYGNKYELGNKYYLNSGVPIWSKNGFHFCVRPEDTLRYVDGFNDEIEMVEVEASGTMILHEDEYYGFYDMYVSSEMEFKRIV